MSAKVFEISKEQHQSGDELLVLLHGLGCSNKGFKGVFDTPLAKQYSILALDFLGFGKSDKPYDFDYTLESHAAIASTIVEGVAKDLKIKRKHLVAHSLGGAVGLLMAPQLTKLTSFINAEGNLIGQDCGIVSRDTVKHGEDHFVRRGYDEFLGKLRQSDDKAEQEWAKQYSDASRVALYRTAESLVSWSDTGELLDRFNNLNVSKAFMYGDRSEVPALSGLRKTATVSIENSGHFMMADNPYGFYAAIGDFAQRASRQADA